MSTNPARRKVTYVQISNSQNVGKSMEEPSEALGEDFKSKLNPETRHSKDRKDCKNESKETE